MVDKRHIEQLLFLIEDRCAAAALVIEDLAETMIDRHESSVEIMALESTARELRTLEQAAGSAQVWPERIPELVAQLETLWCGPEPKSLMTSAPTIAKDPRCIHCAEPLAAHCARCEALACATCDLCHGCQRMWCSKCNSDPTIAPTALPGDRWPHPQGEL